MSRALFPENAFSARVDSFKGWQSRAARENLGGFTTQTVSLRDQFANSTNVDDKQRGKWRERSVEGSVGMNRGRKSLGRFEREGLL